MKIFGLDFTSAPSPKKPISSAMCFLHDHRLQLQASLQLSSFAEFEELLCSPGPWLAALDFPFGQPRKLLSDLAWPQTWEGYMQVVATMGKEKFEETLTRYREGRSKGDKQHLRATDRRARACSPMMLHRVPVGKMFFQGATRLSASDVSVLPCRPTGASRIVIEGYPALVARRFAGKCSYKSDECSKQTAERETVRKHMLSALRSQELLNSYGLTLELSDSMAATIIQDPKGDSLDALLCAVQAAWAYTQRDNGYGIAPDCDKDEGCIVDPFMMQD